MGAGGRLRSGTAGVRLSALPRLLKDPLPAAGIFVFALVLRVWLIHVYPVIFGTDTVLRLVNRDRIVDGHQLPLLPAALHYLAYLSDDATAARCMMAAFGALACAGFFLLMRDLVDPLAAGGAALLFAVHPFLTALSIVPFQEIPMLALLLFAFHSFNEGRVAAASVWLALAAMTRFESWAACPVLAAAWALQRPREKRLAGVVQGCLLFGWAPLAWIVFRRGLAPAGSYVVEASISPERLWRYVYLGWIVVKNTPVPALVLAALGVAALIRERRWREPRVAVLEAFFAVFLLAIPFSAHGLLQNPERLVTAREATLPLAAILLACGFGLTWRSATVRGFAWALAAAGLGLGLWGTSRYIARETAAPDLQLSYRLAQYLDRAVGPGERAVVLAKPMDPAGIRFFVDSAQRTGGAQAREAALRELRSTDTASFEYLCTLAYSHLGRQRLRTLSQSEFSNPPVWTGPPPEWVALWSDFRPSNAAEEELLKETSRWRLVETLRAGGLSVLLFHRPAL